EPSRCRGPYHPPIQTAAVPRGRRQPRRTDSPMSRLTIEVNGAKHSVEATVDTPLLYVLRNELRLHGPRFGCGLAQCGACTVHHGDQAIRACVTPVGAVTDKPLTTLEGLGTPDKPHPLQTAFIERGERLVGDRPHRRHAGSDRLVA